MEKDKPNDFEDYYKKKGAYNKKLQNRKDKILSQEISKLEKRMKIKKIKLPCIFCKRPVNTIFENKNGYLFAGCGSNDNPCDTTIKIESNGYFMLDKIISLFEELIEINKTKINKLKYQTLYSFLSTEKSSEKFKKMINEYNENMACYITHLRKYSEIYEQKEKNDLLNETHEQFNNFVKSIKFTILQFNENKQSILLTDAIDSLVEDIIPLLKKMRTLKYAHSEIIKNKEKIDKNSKETNFLVTRNIPFESLEHKFENINSDNEDNEDNKNTDSSDSSDESEDEN